MCGRVFDAGRSFVQALPNLQSTYGMHATRLMFKDMTIINKYHTFLDNEVRAYIHPVNRKLLSNMEGTVMCVTLTAFFLIFQRLA